MTHFDKAITYDKIFRDLCGMKDPKKWLIWGATDGLGPAAVKYLRANKQMVVVDIKHLPAQLDFMINNSNYHLFSKGTPDIDTNVSTTMALLHTALPYLKPDGTIINIPPQLCLATVEDPVQKQQLQWEMDSFLSGLRRELQGLNRKLYFIEPGERLFEPSYI